jgi:hypothetical protein
LALATPEYKWQKTVLQPLIQQAVRGEALRPYIVPEQALKYWEFIDRSQQKSFVPWRWLNLSLWIKQYGLA